jgi:hypothetical protein
MSLHVPAPQYTPTGSCDSTKAHSTSGVGAPRQPHTISTGRYLPVQAAQSVPTLAHPRSYAGASQPPVYSLGSTYATGRVGFSTRQTRGCLVEMCPTSYGGLPRYTQLHSVGGSCSTASCTTSWSPSKGASLDHGSNHGSIRPAERQQQQQQQQRWIADEVMSRWQWLRQGPQCKPVLLASSPLI